MKKLIKILLCIFFITPIVLYGQGIDSTGIDSAMIISTGIDTAAIVSTEIDSAKIGTSKMDYNFIDSYPQNAAVHLNDEFIGKTPLFFEWKDSLFPKTIRISLNGFHEQSEIITGSVLINKKYNLSSNGKHTGLNTVKEDKIPYFKEPRKVVPIVLSSLVTAASGFAAFHFKSLASENRKDYEVFGEQSSLDNEKKYNLLGGLSVVALQIGFGALMYFLFLD